MRDEPNGIGPKYAIRLGDLREWHQIEVRCFSCGRVGVLYPDQAEEAAHSPAQAEAPMGALV